MSDTQIDGVPEDVMAEVNEMLKPAGMETADTTGDVKGADNADGVPSAPEEEEGTELELSDIEKAKAGTPKGVQERIDRLRREREEARREKELFKQQLAEEAAERKRVMDLLQAQLQPNRTAQREEGPPNPDDYEGGKFNPQYQDDVLNYRLEALEKRFDGSVTQRMEQKFQELQEQREREKVLKRIDESRNTYAEKHTDFFDVEKTVFSTPGIENNVGIVESIVNCSDPARMVYEIGTNPETVKRLAKMSPYVAAMEIGKIEKGWQEPAKQKSVSAAGLDIPDPIPPTRGTTVNTPSFSTEWIEKASVGDIADMLRKAGSGFMN